jgi:uncharacterized protein
MHEDWQQAEFRFYEELNDFLSPERRRRSSAYLFRGQPAIKDAIEAMGVPHTEVDLILVNGQSVDFAYRLQAGDRVSVYPVFESLDLGPVNRLRPRPLREPKFICDVHLGRLARRMRLLGFDVAYRNDADDPEIVGQALAEKRIILTRDRGMLKLKRVTHGCLIHSPDVDQQVLEVLRRFDLASRIEPFSRCTDCNGRIEPVDKAAVQEAIPKASRIYTEFFRCQGCGKVYWKGSHFARLEAYVRQVRGSCRVTS